MTTDRRRTRYFTVALAAAWASAGVAAPAFACDEALGLKVVIASGNIASDWSRGSVVCDDAVIEMAPGDFLLLRNRASTRRLRGPGRFKIETSRAEPVTGVTEIIRDYVLRSLGVGKSGKSGRDELRLTSGKFA